MLRKHLPRYPLGTATLLGRLAISGEQQKTGLGALLLADALRRAYASAVSVGSSMLSANTLLEFTRRTVF